MRYTQLSFASLLIRRITDNFVRVDNQYISIDTNLKHEHVDNMLFHHSSTMCTSLKGIFIRDQAAHSTNSKNQRNQQQQSMKL